MLKKFICIRRALGGEEIDNISVFISVNIFKQSRDCI